MRYAKLWLPGLLLAAVLTLAACGGAGGMNEEGHAGKGGGSKDEMQGMDHGKNKKEKVDEKAGGMSGMDHSNMDHGPGGTASGMLTKNGRYSDERFIDAMVPHHEGAVEMAEVALENAEHAEIKRLSEDIVSAQKAEIKELKSIKEQEFGTSEAPMRMDGEDMKAMGMTDPGRLADREPFDRAFIDAMIPHHRSAIEMAQVALKESENPKIEEISRAIVEAQRQEISRMQQWRKEWYPRG